jgi:hydrogenase maturation protein HypF
MAMNKQNSTSILARIRIRGVVQGVGFRPFIYKLALRYNLKGWIYNSSEDVKIEVEGATEAVRQFQQALQAEIPPLAHIENMTVSYHSLAGHKTFEIRHSVAEEGKYQLISPDIATCQDCLNELLDPKDRRYRYPFTNCTNCGPRFTIIDGIPYDRVRTTMRHFQMCTQCQAEYDNPVNRRFHAQPNACPVCGPRLELLDRMGQSISQSDPIAQASQFLKKGSIVAIKGLGGFLLACDATNETAVSLLRQRKKRPYKPFAIMVHNIDAAREHCSISPDETKLLSSLQSPILLLKWKQGSSIVREVAPQQKYLGVMLPYTPLHHLLLSDTCLPLVMTSGNLSEEPIAKDNDEALRRLHGIADYFLVHNRDIYSSYDDSVAIVESGTTQLIRRARGYAPYPIHLEFQCKQLLACGAEMKNTFCLARDNYAFVSQHIGDMENLETLEHFMNTISLYEQLFDIHPKLIAHDLHPDYLSSHYAKDLGATGLKTIGIQHHHAHLASCMADNRVASPVIGVVFDGTGWGEDGNIWGGEFMVADYQSFSRIGHLEYLPLPGGDAATKRPYRTAISYLLSLLGEKALDRATSLSHNSSYRNKNDHTSDISFENQASQIELDIIKSQIARKLNSPLTSSMGRLFDAVSALLGIREIIDYEGQAAIELEMAACDENYINDDRSYPFQILQDKDITIVKLNGLFTAILEDMDRKFSQAAISIRFHNTIADIAAEMCRLIASWTGIQQVALSGGVFQNRLLLRKTISLLEKDNLKVLIHRQVPCNDGGISLGQAVIANFIS